MFFIERQTMAIYELDNLVSKVCLNSKDKDKERLSSGKHLIEIMGPRI